MVVGVALLVVGVLVVAIWVIIEMQRMKHKFYAFFLVGLVLFVYLTATFSFRGQDVDFTTISGFGKATKIYFNFLLGSLSNLKVLTSHAVEMEWKGNETEG